MMDIEFVSEPQLVELHTLPLWHPFRRKTDGHKRLHLRGQQEPGRTRILCPAFRPESPELADYSAEANELVYPVEVTSITARFVEAPGKQ